MAITPISTKSSKLGGEYCSAMAIKMMKGAMAQVDRYVENSEVKMSAATTNAIEPSNVLSL